MPPGFMMKSSVFLPYPSSPSRRAPFGMVSVLSSSGGCLHILCYCYLGCRFLSISFLSVMF